MRLEVLWRPRRRTDVEQLGQYLRGTRFMLYGTLAACGGAYTLFNGQIKSGVSCIILGVFFLYDGYLRRRGADQEDEEE